MAFRLFGVPFHFTGNVMPETSLVSTSITKTKNNGVNPCAVEEYYIFAGNLK
jgi:hypothetical protein